MFEFAWYHGRRRIKGAGALTVGLGLLTALYVWMFPTITAEVNLDEYVEAWPPALRQAFGVESLSTIEGFLASELYAFGWVLLLGLYVAYSAASLVADDVEHDRMDMTLSLPVTRSRVLVEKFASMLVPILLVNLLMPVVVYAGVLAIGESIAVGDLVMVHLLSVPYLLASAAVGLLASVAVDRASIAQRAAVGVVFGLFLVDSVTSGTEFSWLGAVSPTRYYDPTAILVRGQWDLQGAAVLLGTTLVLVLASRELFRRKDIA
ncbi:ABC transporter permease [Haloarchaeobius iranensis]|uniref:ABC-2 type transport system permease protein n=1 Tax=Haloarchaeobius iranensis TaxID=996166 RepID=A0A1G9YGG9_9EURY|nr:ABC transporter permease subunit [Haloarchaeobius iranensis]SDN07656.1 ABC-2 type transport system permease protein [Haloarchaeobius iranensis]